MFMQYYLEINLIKTKKNGLLHKKKQKNLLMIENYHFIKQVQRKIGIKEGF